MRHDLEQLQELTGSVKDNVNGLHYGIGQETNFHMTMGQ